MLIVLACDHCVIILLCVNQASELRTDHGIVTLQVHNVQAHVVHVKSSLRFSTAVPLNTCTSTHPLTSSSTQVS